MARNFVDVESLLLPNKPIPTNLDFSVIPVNTEEFTGYIMFNETAWAKQHKPIRSPQEILSSHIEGKIKSLKSKKKKRHN